MNYWQKRAIDRQDFLNKRTQKEIDKQIIKYYEQVMKRLIKEFEAVYDKLLTTKEENLTPADLYKMDRYWQMVAQVKEELHALGDQEVILLAAQFEQHWRTSYENTEKEMLTFFNKRAKKNKELKELEWPPTASFTTISDTAVQQMVNEVWCADGKTWSERVWNNVGELATMLNDELIHCVVTGKKTTELKKRLVERFNVSYSKANRLVRTEVAHIQTQASAKRYKEAGLERYEILGREEGSCKKSSKSKGIDCHKMDGKTFLYSEMKVGVNAPPFHPNCRCAIAPVFDDD
jgi:SPP1 gp7 family putative phage head morphogenesis protein